MQEEAASQKTNAERVSDQNIAIEDSRLAYLERLERLNGLNGLVGHVFTYRAAL